MMGLFINDLNMYDSSRDMVMAGWQHASKLECSIEQVRLAVNSGSQRNQARSKVRLAAKSGSQ